MTTLNGLPRSWDSFIQGIYAKNKLVKFSRLWEEYSQEEALIAVQEENMGSEYQALTVHSKKSKRSSHHSRGKHFYKNNSRKDLSRSRFFTCDEVGHFAKDCPKRQNKKKATRKDIILMLQRMMNHPRRKPDMKVKTLQVIKNMY